MAKPKLKLIPTEIKLDIGCGKNKREGFHGVDCIDFDGVDTILDAGLDTWPWKNDTVTEIHTSHFVEHLTARQRVHFVNEAWRVLMKDAKMTIITPHWASGRAYGDPTHQWPPVSEMWYYYLDPKWRAENAPHTDFKHNIHGFKCHFDCTWGYGMHSMLMTRNQEFQQFALNFYREAAQDLHATLTARK